MLRTLLFAALMGVVTANNATNETASTAAPYVPNQTPTTPPAVTTKFVYEGSVKFESQNFATGTLCLANAACVANTATYIKNSIGNSTGGGYPEITILTMTDGSIAVKYASEYVSLPASIPTKEQLQTAMADVANQGGLGFGLITDISATAAVAQSSATAQQQDSGLCSFQTFTDPDCLKAATASTNTVLVATPQAAFDAQTAKPTGTACAQFPNEASTSISVGSFIVGGEFSYATNGVATCLKEQYKKGILGVTCVKSDSAGPGTTKYVRVQCAKTAVVPTSNAVGAGLSAVATVVAFLMM